MSMYTSDGTKIADTPNGDIVLPDPRILSQMKKDHEKLQDIADSLAEEVKLAKGQAQQAQKDSEKARVKSFWASLRSWISIGIAAMSLLVAFLTNIEKVGLGWQAILQWFSAVLHLG